jgi:DNA-binding CsgD family transcriptional regulator
MAETPSGSVLSYRNEVPLLRDTLDAFVRDTGYRYYTYLSGKVVAGRRITNFDPRERPFHLTNVPEAWETRYSHNRFYDHDPIMLFALFNVVPGQWSAIVKRDRLTAKQRQVVADAEDAGLRGGIIVPIHGPGGEFAVLSLSHSETDKQGRANAVTDEAYIHMFALRFHSIVRTLREPGTGVPPADLTHREIDVLFWTAEGKSTWDISRILNISEATVNFHINSAKRKLGVYSKPHAVARMYAFSERKTF